MKDINDWFLNFWGASVGTSAASAYVDTGIFFSGLGLSVLGTLLVGAFVWLFVNRKQAQSMEQTVSYERLDVASCLTQRIADDLFSPESGVGVKLRLDEIDWETGTFEGGRPSTLDDCVRTINGAAGEAGLGQVFRIFRSDGAEFYLYWMHPFEEDKTLCGEHGELYYGVSKQGIGKLIDFAMHAGRVADGSFLDVHDLAALMATAQFLGRPGVYGLLKDVRTFGKPMLEAGKDGDLGTSPELSAVGPSADKVIPPEMVVPKANPDELHPSMHKINVLLATLTAALAGSGYHKELARQLDRLHPDVKRALRDKEIWGSVKPAFRQTRQALRASVKVVRETLADQV